MIDLTRVVPVGGPHERAAEPGQREDRPVATGRDDRGRAEGQVPLGEDYVGAPARVDVGNLGLGVDLLGAEPICPHPGRVDHLVGAHIERATARAIDAAHPGGATALLEQLLDLAAVDAHRAEALGLPEHGEREPHVVGLAVVEEVAAGRAPRGQRGQVLEDLVGADRAVTVGAPVLTGSVAVTKAAVGATAQPLARHHVVHVERHAHEAVGVPAVEGGDDHGQGLDQVRGELDHQRALEQRLADEPEIEALQVAQAAVHELRRSARGPGRVVAALDEGHAVAPRGGVESDARAGDSATDHDHVEPLGLEGGEGGVA